MTQAASKLRVLGCNDEQTECDACGKVELRKTVILCDEEGTEVGRYGTSCAGRKLGYKLTAQSASLTELARRQYVRTEIRQAWRRLASGDVSYAAMCARDARRHGIHRQGEIDAVTAIEALTATRIPGRNHL